MNNDPVAAIEQSITQLRGILAGLDLESQEARTLLEGTIMPFMNELVQASASLISAGQFDDALRLGRKTKALRLPVQGLDFQRALAFIAMGETPAAREALKEELRYFPNNAEAQALLDLILKAEAAAPRLPDDVEFKKLLVDIQPYTMVCVPRLHSLYHHARRICEEDVPGDFVECGVAAGGSSALLAAVIKRHSKRPRRLYSCDSFEGMPVPTNEDIHEGVHAEDTDWGSGTCAAPQDSLEKVCRALAVWDLVTPIKGYFEATLPDLKDQLDDIAFLHLDGDWYLSTRDILTNLYDKVHPRGFMQADDYGYWQGCSKALHEFEAQRGLHFKLQRIDSSGVWFGKPLPGGKPAA